VPRHRGGDQPEKGGGCTKESGFCHVFLAEFSGKQDNQRITAKFRSRFLKDI
jgi:hypothetical protein